MSKIRKILKQVLGFSQKAAAPWIFHGDLKEENIMIGDDYLVTNVDFGSTRRGFCNRVVERETYWGTRGYIPLELRVPEGTCKIAHRSTLEKVEV